MVILTGLEHPLLQTGQGPALDHKGQGEPAQEIAEVVRDAPQEQSQLVRPETVAGEEGPVGAGRRCGCRRRLLRLMAEVRDGDGCGAYRVSGSN